MIFDNKGYILLHRKIKDNFLYKEKRKFSRFEAWLDILIECNHDEKKVLIKGHLFNVGRGESIRSLLTMADAWGWNKNAVKTFLDLLKSDSMIQTVNETVTTRLIVCNYSQYQSFKNADQTETKRKLNADETQTKRAPNADGNKQNTNKTLNTLNTQKEYINAPKPHGSKCAYSEDEQFFWKYASNVARPEDTKSKAQILKKYRARRNDGFTQDQMLTFVDLHTEQSRSNWERRFGLRSQLEKDNLEQILNGQVKRDKTLLERNTENALRYLNREEEIQLPF